MTMYDARRNNSWVVVVHLPTSQVDLIAQEIGFSILDEKDICLTLLVQIGRIITGKAGYTLPVTSADRGKCVMFV